MADPTSKRGFGASDKADGGTAAEGSHGAGMRLLRLKYAAFSVCADINTDLSIHPVWGVFLMVIETVQLLSFPLNPDRRFGIASESMGLAQALQPLFFRTATEGVAYSPSALMIAASAITLFLASLFLFATYLAMQVDDPVNEYKAYHPRWPSQILRFGLRTMLLGFFVPLLLALVQPLDCMSGQTWSTTGLSCFSGMHGFYVALSVVCMPTAVVLLLMSAAVLVDRKADPKRNLLGQAHGRTAALMVLVKTALCFIFLFSAHSGLSNLVPLLASLAAGLAWLVLYARTMPYHVQWVNNLQCALSGIFLSACVAALLSEATPKGRDASVGSYALVLTAPLAAFVCWSLSVMSASSYRNRRELGSPYAVELQTRWMLRDIQAEESSGGTSLGTGVGGFGMAASKTANRDSSAGVERSANGVLLNDTFAKKRDIQTLYEEAASVFSASAMLELFAASYLGHVMQNGHLEIVHLRAATAKADTSALDIKFFVWERLRAVEEEESASDTVRTSVIRRLAFDTLQAESEKLCMRARTLMLDFWTECCEKMPDMHRMQSLGTEIIITMRQGENVFKQMIELSPASAAVMRQYADFLLDIANNPKQALELLATAEQIEEEQSKAHMLGTNDTADYPLMTNKPDFDLSGESVSLVRVDATSGSVGTLMDANNAALRMFGFSRREIMGKSIDGITPEPIASAHSRYLLRYLETGEVRVVNQSRIYLGLHKSGHIFPMCANVRPLESGFGAVFESITTSQAYILFMGVSARWKITGICRNTSAALDLSTDDVKAGVVTMHKLCPSLVEAPAARRASATMAGLEPLEAEEVEQPGPPQPHSPLMTELINASNNPGTGVDIVLHVIDWKRAVQAQSRVHWCKSANTAANHSTLGGGVGAGGGPGSSFHHAKSSHSMKGMMDGHQQHTGEGEDADVMAALMEAQQELAAAYKPLRNVLISAKLQEIHLAYLPTPLYCLRWRPSKDTDPLGAYKSSVAASALAAAAAAAREAEEDGDSTAPADSVDAESDRDSAEDDGEGEGSDRKALLKAPLAASMQGPALHSALKKGAGRGAAGTGLEGKQVVGAGKVGGEAKGDTGRRSITFKPSFASQASGQATGQPASEADGYSSASDNDGEGSGSGSESGSGSRSGSDTASRSAGSPASAGRRGRKGGRMSKHSSGLGSFNGSSGGGDGGCDSEDRQLATINPLRSGELAGPSGGEGPIPGGKARSAASGSVTGGGHMSDVLRKGIMLHSRDMETSLVALRRALMMVFLVVGAVNIASTAITTTLFNELIKAINLVEANGERGIALQRAYAEISVLRFMADGTVPSSTLLPTGQTAEEAHRAVLAEELDKLDRMHRELYLKSSLDTAGTLGASSSSSSSSALSTLTNNDALSSIPGTSVGNSPTSAELWKIPFVVVRDVQTGGGGTSLWYGPTNYSYTNRSINLGDAGLEFVAKGRQIMYTPLSNLSMANPLVFWTVTNGPTAIRSAFNESMLVAQDLTKGQAETVTLVNIVVLAVALSLQFIMVAFVMMPAVRKVLVQKTQVFQVFLATPLTVLRQLRQQMENRIEAMRRAAEEAEAGMDIAGAGDHDGLNDFEFADPSMGRGITGGAGGAGGGSGGERGFTADSRADDASYAAHGTAAIAASLASKEAARGKDRESASASPRPWYKRLCACGTHSVHATPGGRHFRNSTASVFNMRVVRFLLPMIALVAYYYGTYMWKQSEVVHSQYFKSEVFYTNQVAFMVGQSDFNVRNMLAMCDGPYVDEQARLFKTLVSTMQMLQDDLLYGNDHRQVRPLLAANVDFFHIMMEDGCLPPALSKGRYTVEECQRTFFNGLVGHGLQAALKEYIELAQRVRIVRTAAVRDPASCRPVNFMADPSAALATQLAEVYLSPGLQRAASIVGEHTTSELASFTTLDVAVTCASIAGLLLFYFAIYSPMIRRMDQEIKNVRHMLLLFPDEISASVPALVAAGKELMKEGTSVSFAGASSKL